MASGGVGKIKTKKGKDAGKPYDRPQTLLQRVGSTLWNISLGDLLPSFLRESSWRSTSTDKDDGKNQEDVTEAEADDIDVDCVVETDNNLQVMGPSSDAAESSVMATKEGYMVECGGYQALFPHSSCADDHNPAPTDGSPISRPPLFSATDRASGTPYPNAQPSTSRGAAVSMGAPSAYYGSSSKRSAPQPDDEGDVLSADAAAVLDGDKSGAPAKKRCVEKDNVRTAVANDPCQSDRVPAESGRTTGGEKSFVWQTKSNAISASRSRSWMRSTPAASVKKPRFDLPTFCTTINNSNYGIEDSSLSNATQTQSPFYSGKTTYGGASARPKTMTFEPEYQVMPTVRHEPKRVSAGTSAGNERPLSLTAKLILQGMDKTEQLNNVPAPTFNTSLSDSLLSFTPTTYKRHSLQASSSRTQPKMGPPVLEQATPTFTAIQRSIRAYQANPQPDVRTAGRTENTDMDVGRGSMNAPATYDLPTATPSTHTSGKMRRETTRTHYTNRAAEMENGTPMTVDLPSIRLSGTNLQPFSNVSSSSSGAFFAGPPLRPAEPMDTATFKFSEPFATKSDSKPPEEAQQKGTLFHFRSPITVDDHRSNGVAAALPQQPPGAATSGAPVKSSLSFNFNLNTAVKKAQPTSESPSGGFAPAPELKRGSVMDLLGGPSNAPSSKATPDASTPFATSSATKLLAPAAGAVTDQRPLSELFKTPSNKWSCPGCYAQNDSTQTKCPCCGESMPSAIPPADPAPATSGFPAQASVLGKPIANPLSELFKPSGDTWTCPTCDVKNANRLDSCPCCTTARPSVSKSHSVTSMKSGSAMSLEEVTENVAAPKSSNLPSLSSLFQKPPGDWVCQTCSLQNKVHQIKCGVCDEPKPGAKPVPSNGAVSLGFTAGSNGAQVDSQGFKSVPGTFGSKAPDGTGIAPGGGFRMTIPPGGFSGFGTGFTAPQTTSDKPDAAPFVGGFKATGFSAPQPAVNKSDSFSGGFKPTGISAPQSAVDKSDSALFSGALKPTEFACFGQATPKNDTNGPVSKPEILSFLPPGKAPDDKDGAVKTSFSGTFGSTEQNPSGFGFKPSDACVADVIAKPVGFTFGSTFGSTSANPPGPALGPGFRFGVVASEEKDDVKASSEPMQRPPLRPEKDNDNANCNVDAGKVDIGGNDREADRSDSTLVAVGSNQSVVSTASSVFGASVSSSSLFGQAKPTADTGSAPKFDFTAASGSISSPLAAFGASSFSAPGATQPVFSAPSSITSAAVAPSVPTTAGGLFTQPAIPDKPTGQEAVKSNPFAFCQKPAEGIPSIFKFGGSQPGKEEEKPAPASIFQFGQQPPNPAPTGLFQFGAGSNIAGAFNSTTNQPAAVPVFGQPAASTSGVFNFGAGTNAQSNPAGIFTFGAKPTDGASKPDVTPSFDDGTGSKRGRSGSNDMTMQDVESIQTPKQPSVGFTFNAPQTGFGFGAPQTSTPVNNAGLFGGKPGNHVPGASPFAFTGQQSAAPAPAAFGSQSVSNLANGSANTGFSFAASAAAPLSFNFGGPSQGFNFAAAPSNPNFAGAAPSNPSGSNPFNAAPSGPVPPGRTFKRAIRRTIQKK